MCGSYTCSFIMVICCVFTGGIKYTVMIHEYACFAFCKKGYEYDAGNYPALVVAENPVY